MVELGDDFLDEALRFFIPVTGSSAGSVLKNTLPVRYMEVPPKERKLFKSSNLRGLCEFISYKP